MSNKTKIYYRLKDGFICNRYPTDIPIENENQFIEVDEVEANKTYSIELGKHWAVLNNNLCIVDDVEYQQTEEYKTNLIKFEKMELQDFLNNTDYIISKLNELKLEDEEEYEIEKNKYSDILTKRKEARVRIRELENNA